MRGLLLVLILAVTAAGCVSRAVVLDVQGTILYEKPAVDRIEYTVADGRRDGGRLVVTVTITGDSGLAASFDITPGIVASRAMTEGVDGTYTGEYTFAAEVVGGPFTIIGRLRHPQAGEVVVRDPDPLTIPLLR